MKGNLFCGGMAKRIFFSEKFFYNLEKFSGIGILILIQQTGNQNSKEMSMISYNHIGYLPGSPKVFYIDEPQQESFSIFTIDESVQWREIYQGKLEKCGNVYKGDFSSVTVPGDYNIRCGQEISNNFVIKEEVYNHLERLVANCFSWQRCGSKKGWAGLCHQELDNLYGTGKKLDMRGGYHQSGDLRCWHDGCSSAVYGYLRYAEESEPLWDEGILEEEIRWGVDYFRKTVSPEGFIYDCQFVPLGWGPRDYYNSPAALSDHYNICRLLARSSLYFRESDPAYASENLALAEKVWQYVEKSDFFDKPYVPPVEDLPGGTQGKSFYWQNRKNCTGMDCASSACAYDLYKATGKEEYEKRYREDLDKVIACQIPEGEASGIFRDSLSNHHMAFHDCGYGHIHSEMVYLADLILNEKDSPHIQKWKDALEKYSDMLVREFEFQGFGGDLPVVAGRNYLDDLPPGAPFLENTPIELVHHKTTAPSRAARVAFVLMASHTIFGKKEYLLYAQHALDYIVGGNPGSFSYITGIGYNHTRIAVFGQFFPSTPQIPGGICHVKGGEYDIPVNGILLRTLTKFRK